MPLTLSDSATIQLQGLVTGLQHGANQLFAIGANFYLVMLAQVGTVPTNDLQVWKSTDKTTWTLAATYADSGPPLQTSASADCPCCVVGNVIYILGVLINSVGPVVKMLFHPFDTATDSFLADSALSAAQGGAGQQLWSCSPLNDGRIVVSSTITPGPHLTTQTYAPATDSWSVVTNQTNDSSKPLQQIHDPASDRTFIFYQKAATNELRCLVLDGTPVAVGDVTVFTLVAGPVFISIIGMPIVTDTEIILPYRWFPIAAAPEQKVARLTIADSPVVTLDLVDDASALPVSNAQIQQWDQIAGPGSFSIVIDDLLYCFYAVDNGELNDASSQTFLFYRSSTGPGVWSDPALAYESVVPGEMMTPYGVIDAFGNPLIILGIIDPTLWDDISSLTNFVLFVANPPQVGYASGKIINAALLQPVALNLDYVDNTGVNLDCFPMPKKGSC